MSSNFSFSQRRFSLVAETGIKTDEPFWWRRSRHHFLKLGDLLQSLQDKWATFGD